MAQVNFPAPSESPWTNTESGVIYKYVNGTWKAIGATSIAETLPDGNAVGDVLTWDGSNWNPLQPTDELPDGTTEGDYLRWNGTAWTSSNVIDGGIYAT
jgi:hypothetical protein